jgi:glycosyltransferase involved in cell wall biosynthesis
VCFISKDKPQEEKMTDQAKTFVSVVMATYNHEKYLGASIRSILSQTHSNFELIIVNDNSPDGSDDIIREFAATDERIVYLPNERNLKLSACRNKAIKAAKGDFIVIVDSDDICTPDRLEKQLNHFDTHPDCDVLGSSFCLFFDSNVEVCNSVVTANTNDIYHGQPLVHGPTCMIRRSVFVAHGFFNSKYDDAEDYELWSRWFARGVIFNNIADVLYKKRIHEGCVSLVKMKHQIYLMLKINLIAVLKYRRRFSKAGYHRMLEQFLRLIYLSLRLDRIFRRSSAFDRMQEGESN